MKVEEIRSKMEQLYPEFLADLETITAFERGSQNIPGLNQMKDFMQTRLEALGCSCETSFDEKYGPTLIARKKGTGTARIMMFAHMDTVWPAGTCEKRKFSIQDQFAYGPGVSDCSHGLLGTYYTLRILSELGFEDYGELIFLFNPDEEVGSTSSKALIQKCASEADVAICMEGPNNDDEFIVARGGSMYFEMRVYGRSAHAGFEPERGRNAIGELINKLNLIQQLRIEKVVPNLSTIQGGNGDCSVADYAMSHFRFRVDSFEVMPLVHKAVEAIANTCVIDGTRTEYDYFDDQEFPPMIRREGSELYEALVVDASTELGIPLKPVFCGGASDGAFASLGGAITLDGLTPMTYGCHTERENMDLSTVVPRISLTARLVERISKDPKYWIKSGK